MKKVTILLTKYTDFWGRFARGINGDGFSHASISIDEKEEIFYSFNVKGFAIEKPKKYWPKKKMPGSLFIRIHVPEDIYNTIQNIIQKFINQKEQYSFTKLGVVLCYLHIPHKFQNKYFCSQFVAEVLSQSGAVELKKKESLYMPNHFINDLIHHYPLQHTYYSSL